VRTIEKGDHGWNRPVVTEGRMGDRSYVRHAPRQGFDTGLNERGVRTARWKYVRYSTGEVELYDLKNDPLELESRQDDPAYDRIRHELERVWEQYYDCKGTGCAEPLTPEFRATVAQTKAITDNEFRRIRGYYDDGLR
jgi:N-acetylglucosamine-6-sulfatase